MQTRIPHPLVLRCVLPSAPAPQAWLQPMTAFASLQRTALQQVSEIGWVVLLVLFSKLFLFRFPFFVSFFLLFLFFLFSAPESCQLPPESGLCEAYMPSYFYNSTAGNCHIFIYGGCQGNDNRYTTYQECMETCCECVNGWSCDHHVTCSFLHIIASLEVGLPTVDAEYTTKDSCPVTGDAIGACDELCSMDDDCSSAELCCSNGCGHSCVESAPLPYYSPPMSCPAIDPLFGIFCTLNFGCEGHDECGSGELCCPTGCGSACKTAVVPTPLCTEVNAQASSSGLLGAFVPQCDSQGNFSLVQCHEGQCWCVDPATGVPTATPPTMYSVPNCGQSSKFIVGVFYCSM